MHGVLASAPHPAPPTPELLTPSCTVHMHVHMHVRMQVPADVRLPYGLHGQTRTHPRVGACAAYFEGAVSPVQQARAVQIVSGGSGPGTQSPPQHVKPSQHSNSPQQTSSG